VCDCEALAALDRLFDFLDHRDRGIFHRNMTFTLGVGQQLIAAEPKAARALAGSEVCGRERKAESISDSDMSFRENARGPLRRS
jgi:hypothetical protein